MSKELEEQLKQCQQALADSEARFAAVLAEQQETEKELRLAKEKYQTLFTHANDAIFIVDPETYRFLDVNEKAAQYLGYTREKLLTFTFNDINAPMPAEKNEAIIRQLKETGHVLFEHGHQHKDGHHIPVEISSRVTNYGGKSVFQSIVRDITERKQKQAMQTAVVDIAQTANTAQDMADFYQQVQQTLQQFIPAHNFYIAWYDSHSNQIYFPYFVDKFDTPPPPRQLENGLTEYVIQHEQPLLTTPTILTNLIANGEVELRGHPPIHWLGVPLKTATQQTIGVVAVQSYDENIKFSAFAQELLQFVSVHIVTISQRLQTVTELQTSEEKYRLLIENAPVGIMSADDQGNILEVNPAMLQILGSPSAKATQKINLLTFPLLVKMGFSADIQHVLQTGERLMVERPYTSSWGKTTYLRTFLTPTDNTQSGIQIIAEDITDRKQTENALRESETTLRTLLNATEDLILLWDNQQSIVVDVNKATVKALDISYEQIVGQPLSALFPSEIVQLNLTHAQQVIQTGQPIHSERQRGNQWLETSYYPIFDSDKNVVKIAVFARDITERKLAEEAIRQNEARLRQAQHIARLGIWDWDPNTDITVWMGEMFNIYGITPEEFTGNGADYFGFTHPEDREIQMGNVRRAFELAAEQSAQTGVTVDTRPDPKEFRIIRPDGSICWVRGDAVEIVDQDGNPVKMLGILQDVTSQKESEQRLKQYADELREANAELSQYAYVVSHDLQTPLRAIHNYADFLYEDLGSDLDEEQKLYLNKLNQAVREAEELINSLLVFSQVGKQQIATRNIEMGRFINDLIMSLHLSEDVEIIMAETWPTLHSEPTLLRQVFQNLINNGVKFNTSTSKKIELGWSEVAGDKFQFFVRDNGIGIAPEYHQQIFRVFQRLHTQQEYEGTGVGLSIVRKTVKKLGGTITLESEPGQGSTFLITLPQTFTP